MRYSSGRLMRRRPTGPLSQSPQERSLAATAPSASTTRETAMFSKSKCVFTIQFCSLTKAGGAAEAVTEEAGSWYEKEELLKEATPGLRMMHSQCGHTMVFVFVPVFGSACCAAPLIEAANSVND